MNNSKIKEHMDLAKLAKEKLNVVIVKESKRPNGSVRIQQDFTNCPTMAEQHTAHLSDLNYLISKYEPDALAAYITARNIHRTEIVGHDFSQELSLQEAKNVVLRSRKEFEALPDEIRKNFRNHLEFIKFIDDPNNAQKMVNMGLLTPDQIKELQLRKKSADEELVQQQKKDQAKSKGTTRTTTTQEEEDKE